MSEVPQSEHLESERLESEDLTHEAPPGRFGRLYGRRLGRPLRRAQSGLVETLLPRIAVPEPVEGERIDPVALFDQAPASVWLEIGFGGGEHLAALATAHPEIGFIGCEVFLNGVAKLLGEVSRLGLGNVRILEGDARPLLAGLADRSIGRAFILFPDPWPKLRHHRRRIVQTEILDELGRVLEDGAELRIGTDHVDYMRWILERVTVHPLFEWLAEGPEDWRQRPADWPQTRYEAKAIRAGRAPVFLRLRRRAR